MESWRIDERLPLTAEEHLLVCDKAGQPHGMDPNGAHARAARALRDRQLGLCARRGRRVGAHGLDERGGAQRGPARARRLSCRGAAR